MLYQIRLEIGAEQMKKQIFNRNNADFLDSVKINNQTYQDYLNRFERIAMSRFEWINLPESMNS